MSSAMFYFAILAVLATAYTELPGPLRSKSSGIDLCTVPEPDCDHRPTKKYVKDPKDCTRFFDCEDTNINGPPIPCPESQYFNEQLGDAGSYPPCAASSNCVRECQCVQECLEDGQVYADLQDCGKYYKCICVGPNPDECYSVSEPCKQDTYFNGRECGTNPDLCCP
ncbi:unnamed protein product [Meganyctiphanes norvegica]|uniref:Chitin-binding type-2 domain-containing protein n=1 Tax=Meganyctiphanes norvegica TaxID=48144 RepID=A0AAV2QM31_MEGNR